MDPVIVVGAGPVGLTLALALAAPGRPVRASSTRGRARTSRGSPARSCCARTPPPWWNGCGVAACRGRLPWTGWRSMRRKQLMRECRWREADAPVSGTAGDVRTGVLRRR